MIHILNMICLQKWSPCKDRNWNQNQLLYEYVFLVLLPDKMKIILIGNSRVQHFKFTNDPVF